LRGFKLKNYRQLKSLIGNTVLITAFIIVLALPEKVSGQYNYGIFNYYTAGVKTGYDVYSYSMDPKRMVEHEILPNYSFGISGGWYYKYWLEFHLDILLANRDFTVKWLYPPDPVGKVAAYSKYKLYFLSFPMQARANFIYTRYFKMNVGLGIMPEFRVRPPHEIVTYQNGDTRESYDDFLVNDFNRALFGFPMSLHAKFNFNRHYSMELSASYIYYVVRMNTVLMDKPGKGYYFNLAFYYDW
jgi:hypothetical protein